MTTVSLRKVASNTATKCTTLTDNSVIAQKIPP